ncbi:MAG TPA: dihydrolipoyl dehydrogenase [Candidatus Acidoferrum sp.]|nr:dihydrolipoyl dehydrogenase [Candidatus Acidoferrum sp.]
MEEFNVLVVGSGSGMIVAAQAVANGMKTALVDPGPIGGTCINRGCVPSKMLTYSADIVETIREAEKLGIDASVKSIDFQRILRSMRETVTEDVEQQTRAVKSEHDIKWFKGLGEFVSDYTLKIDESTIKAERIFIVSGARPDIPQIKGIHDVDYLTSDTVLKLETLPRSMIIVGGGYIAAEYGHFFSSMGTEVTIIQRNSRLLPGEEPEVSDLIKKELGRRMAIFTNYEAVEAVQKSDAKIIIARSGQDGSLKEFSAEFVLVATGRVPNSDVLKPQKTGVQLDNRGYVRVNQYLETHKRNIWAFGDAVGKQMFKHVANYEAQIAWHNATNDHKVTADHSAVPHAIFTHPQIASVGLKESEAKRQGHKIYVGTTYYKDTALGAAMGKPEGFAKVILEAKTGKILGGHIIGPHASVLIQEIVNAMTVGDKTFTPILRGMHIHPAMSEVVQNAFVNLRKA